MDSSEEQPLRPEDLDLLTNDALAKHLEAVGAKKECEMCGGGYWDMDYQDSDPDRPLVITNPAYKADDSTFIFLPLTCRTCGNTRLLNTAVIVHAIKERG